MILLLIAGTWADTGKCGTCIVGHEPYEAQSEMPRYGTAYDSSPLRRNIVVPARPLPKPIIDEALTRLYHNFPHEAIFESRKALWRLILMLFHLISDLISHISKCRRHFNAHERWLRHYIRPHSQCILCRASGSKPPHTACLIAASYSKIRWRDRRAIFRDKREIRQ